MNELSAFQKEVGEWADATFNPRRGNNRKAIIYHLIKEVGELLESEAPEEAADCFILLLHHAHTLGYDLLEEARKKMEINQRRKWGNPDKNGVVEHI
jgi:NTP pyrophosphatase (non-canonical NTP hydrolase)